MTEIFNKKYLVNFLILPVFAIGSFYDSRLSVGDINVTYFFSLFFIIGMLLVLKNETNRFILNKWVSLSILIITVSIVNWVIWNINEIDNYSYSKIIVFAFLTFPLGMYVCSFKTTNEINVFLKQVSIIGILLGILGTYQLLKTGGAGEDRLAVFGGGPIVFSRWIGFCFLLLFFNKNVKTIIKLPLLLLSVLLMLFSGSKGPFLFLLVVIFIMNINNKKVLLAISVIFAFVVLNINTIVSLLTKNMMLSRIFGLTDASSYTEGSSSTSRLKLWSDAIDSISLNPFGYGLGNYSVYSDFDKLNGYSGYPHNLFAEIWLESGIIILVVFLVLIYRLFRKSFGFIINKDFKYEEVKTIMSIWMFYFFNSMVSGDFSDDRFLIIFSILYFLSIRLIVEKEKHQMTNL